MTADDRTPVSPDGEQWARGRVSVSHDSGVAVVTMSGEHDLSTAPEVSAALTRAREHSDVLVDLSDCSLIDSTVIGVLISTAKSLEAGGEKLVLALPPEGSLVARVVSMTHLADVFPVHASRADALASLRQG